MNIKIELNKQYYKYINSSIINHYKLLLLCDEYKNIGKKYFNRYPNAKEWINLNEKLFESNKQSEIDYINGSKRQVEIKKEFFKNREVICKNCKNKESIICSDIFEEFYVNQNYHYEQNIQNIIKDITTDIQNMNY